MTLLNTTNAKLCEYLLDNSPVLIFWNEATNEILIELTSLALYLGYQSVEEMMSDTQVLDIINDQLNEFGESPFRRL
ncbi:hypothetical protein GCM10028808_10520 [Spirosoma migulaei]